MNIKKDVFNSNIFGIPMGNIEYCIGELTEKNVEQTLSLAIEQGYSHLTIRLDTNYKSELSILFNEGFYLVDTLVELKFDKGYSMSRYIGKTIFRQFQKGDIKDISRIAKESYKLDRYHSDSKLRGELCDKYYEQWAYNSCNGFAEGVTVAEIDGIVCGFFSYKTHDEDSYSRLVLGAVDSKYRGQKIFQGLIQNTTELILEKHPNLKGVMVGTQLNNISALCSYINVGYKICESSFVLHYCT